MTDTDEAQERVEDWTDEELAKGCDHASKVFRSEGSWELSEHLDAAARRILARQREDGEDDRLVPEACPHCSGLMGHWGDCPHGPQREEEREPVGLQLVERDAFESLEVGINGYERREAQDALDFIRQEYEGLKQKVADLRRRWPVPADAHPEKCELPEGHEGDHMIRSPGAVTMFPDEVAESQNDD